jgi:hypothetical protein
MAATDLHDGTELAYLLDFLRSQEPLASRPFRAKPCEDCAVVCGFYLDYSEALKLAPKEEQLALSERWFCHQTPGLSCRGNANHLQLFREGD